MCKSNFRAIYLKNKDGEVHGYELAYHRISQMELQKEYYKGFPFGEEDFLLWVMGKIADNGSVTVHLPTMKTLSNKFVLAEANASTTYWNEREGQRTPRYITLLTIYSNGKAISGGCSVCAGIDIPDRRYGYKLAFESMKENLAGNGFSIVPRKEAMAILGLEE